MRIVEMKVSESGKMGRGVISLAIDEIAIISNMLTEYVKDKKEDIRYRNLEVMFFLLHELCDNGYFDECSLQILNRIYESFSEKENGGVKNGKA